MKQFGFAVAGLMLLMSGAANAQAVGVPACDDFLTKYDTCVSTKVPGAQQATFKAQVDQMRKSWSDLAKNASTKPTLEASCKQSADAMKASMQAYGCSF